MTPKAPDRHQVEDQDVVGVLSQCPRAGDGIGLTLSPVDHWIALQDGDRGGPCDLFWVATAYLLATPRGGGEPR